MSNKITKREVINMMLNEVAVQENPIYVAYLEHEIELLDKKAGAKRVTKTQEQNVGIKERIIETLATIGSGTVTEIQKASTDLESLSNQKISALLKQLVADGVVVKTLDKKKAIFSAANGGVEGM